MNGRGKSEFRKNFETVNKFISISRYLKKMIIMYSSTDIIDIEAKHDNVKLVKKPFEVDTIIDYLN